MFVSRELFSSSAPSPVALGHDDAAEEAELFAAASSESVEEEQENAAYMVLSDPPSTTSIYGYSPLDDTENEAVLLYPGEDFLNPGDCSSCVEDVQRIGEFLFARIGWFGFLGLCGLKRPIARIDTKTGAIEPAFIKSPSKFIAEFDIDQDKLYMIARDIPFS